MTVSRIRSVAPAPPPSSWDCWAAGCVVGPFQTAAHLAGHREVAHAVPRAETYATLVEDGLLDAIPEGETPTRPGAEEAAMEKPKACTRCHRDGHNAKTCPERKGASAKPARAAPAGRTGSAPPPPAAANGAGPYAVALAAIREEKARVEAQLAELTAVEAVLAKRVG